MADVRGVLNTVKSVLPVETRPASLVGDKAYDTEPLREVLRWLRIEPRIPERGDGSRGLGVIRWAIKRTVAWLHQSKRLHTRYGRRPELHDAFTSLAAAMICFKLFCSDALSHSPDALATWESGAVGLRWAA